MATLEAPASLSSSASAAASPRAASLARGEILDNDGDDDQFVASYTRLRGSAHAAGVPCEDGSVDDVGDEYDGGDDDDDDLGTTASGVSGDRRRKMEVVPLPPLDHSRVAYEPFERDFYTEHPDIARLSEADVVRLRAELGIFVSGRAVPRPCVSFAHFGLDEALLRAVARTGFTRPTPVQAQAVPAALSGRDVLATARTGSGKTLAYLWPLVVHVMDQRVLERGEGPIAFVVLPTRELALQVAEAAHALLAPRRASVCAAFGGCNKREQICVLRAGAEAAVGTPGRLIDLLRTRACTTVRTTLLVIDEADRMFEMGFEPQVRSLVSQIRADRQTLLFAATLRPRLEALAREVLRDPVRIAEAGAGNSAAGLAANADVVQSFHVVPTAAAAAAGGLAEEKQQQILLRARLDWLIARLHVFSARGSVLIFVGTRADAERVCAELNNVRIHAAALHGDMQPADRARVLAALRSEAVRVLVATDVAARGLDVPAVKTVVSLDPPRSAEAHVHRVGRTGRAGARDGEAHTLLLAPRDHAAAAILLRNFFRGGGGGGGGAGDSAAEAQPPEALLALALKNDAFRREYGRRGGAAAGGAWRGGRGRGRGAGGRGWAGRGRAREGVGYGARSGGAHAAPAPYAQGTREEMLARFNARFREGSADDAGGAPEEHDA